MVSVRSARRDPKVKRDLMCTLARAFPPVLVVLRAQSRLGLEGRTRTLSGPSPDLTSFASGLLENLARASSRVAVPAVLSGSGRDNPLPPTSSGHAAGTFAAPEAVLWLGEFVPLTLLYRVLPGVDDNHDYSVLRSRNDRTFASGGRHLAAAPDLKGWPCLAPARCRVGASRQMGFLGQHRRCRRYQDLLSGSLIGGMRSR